MITIVHLYPRSMNTYGDSGNIVCLQRRLQWRGIDFRVVGVEIGEQIPKQSSLYFIGGGQDATQTVVATDLQRHTDRLQADTAAGIPSLSICGGYQLFGRGYVPFQGERLPGVNIFPAETFASKTRMIGNLVIRLPQGLFGGEVTTAVGFENHSGQTKLDPDALPLGDVLAGFGNMSDGKHEGCRIHSALGCYLHGSLLPKNPHIADWLLERAAGYPLEKLDDQLELQAHQACVKNLQN